MFNHAVKLGQWALLIVPSVILLPGLTACGGATGDSGSGGSGGAVTSGGSRSDAGGSSSGSGGANGGGGSGNGGSETSGGGPNSGGANPGAGGMPGGGPGDGGATGSGGDGNAICSLPPDVGDCDAAIPRFVFDSVAGVCVPFSYGGCGGNENNFETLSACDDACRGGEPTPTDACEQSNDCQLSFLGCCGICEPMSLESYSGVNYIYLAALEQESDAHCLGVLCAACAPGEPVSQNYGVTCEDNQCVPYDVRQKEELSSCTEDDDCVLRTGLGCCESCTEESIVALNITADLSEILCDGQNPPCAACEPQIPDTIEAKCTDGTCQVVRN